MPFLENNAEGMPHGTTLAAGQTGSGSPFEDIGVSGTATGIYSNTRSAHGAQSYRITGAADSTYGLRFSTSAGTQAALRAYIYFESLPTTSTMAIATIINTNGGVPVATLAYFNSRLVVQDNAASGFLTTFPTPIEAGQWYRIEMQIVVGTTTSNGTVRAAYYLHDSTTPVDPVFLTTTADTTTATVFRSRIGKQTAAPAVDMFIDNFAFNLGSSDPIGPYVPPANTPPTANAGPDQTVEPWSEVTLNGSGSTDPDGSITSYTWTQTAGTPVTLSSTTTANPTFAAPASIAGETLTFRLTVTDNQGATSSPDTVDITSMPVTERAVIGGQEVPVKLEIVRL